MNAYVTCLSTDKFLNGVLVLYQSLKNTNPKYPFYCIVSDDLSKETLDTMTKCGVDYIVMEHIDVSHLTGRAMSEWDSHYFKFRLFQLFQFEKIVFLDADMLVMHNLDELFDNEPISVCKDDYQFTGIKNKEDIGLNSGLMVLQPDQNFFDKVMEQLPVFISKGIKGDQKIINSILKDPKWLSPVYNMTPTMIDTICYREKYYDFKYEDIKVVHFTWTEKPFYDRKLPFKRFIKILKARRFSELKALKAYYKAMDQIMQ